MSPTARVKTSPRRSSRTANRVTRSQGSAAISVAIPPVITRNPATRGTARRGRPRRTIASTSTPATPHHVDETIQLSVVDITVPVPDVDETVPMPITPEALHNNGQSSVHVVDLITPQPPLVQPTRRPVEVDLTCDLDDEVFVVLEDIVNPSRRTNASDLPVLLGTSPQRARVNVGPRSLRSTFGDRRGNRHVPNELEFYAHSSPSSEVVPSPLPAPSPKEDAHGIQCPICLEPLSKIKEANQQMHTTTCGHVFCGPCITRAIASAHQCPTCRKRQDIRKIHPVFL